MDKYPQELHNELKETFNLGIIEELLRTEDNVTENELKFVMECYEKTKNPWDASATLMLYRFMVKNGLKEE